MPHHGWSPDQNPPTTQPDVHPKYRHPLDLHRKSRPIRGPRPTSGGFPHTPPKKFVPYWPPSDPNPSPTPLYVQLHFHILLVVHSNPPTPLPTPLYVLLYSRYQMVVHSNSHQALTPPKPPTGYYNMLQLQVRFLLPSGHRDNNSSLWRQRPWPPHQPRPRSHQPSSLKRRLRLVSLTASSLQQRGTPPAPPMPA